MALTTLTIVTGCASITTGQNQPLSVETAGCPTATCKLTNEKGAWYVTSTPGTVIVQRAYGDMTVICEKGEYKSNPHPVASTTKGMAFGNILIGGIIGAAVDAGTGAAYDYPAVISVAMICTGDPKTVVQPAAPLPANAQLATSPAGTNAAAPTVTTTASAPPVKEVTPITSPTDSGLTNHDSAAAVTPASQATPAPQQSAGNGRILTTSKFMVNAERFAKESGCGTPIATMTLWTPSYEAFTVACTAAEPRVIRCDGAGCREMK